MKKAFLLSCILLSLTGLNRLAAQTTVSFNFSAAAQPVSGWINVAGDPSLGVWTGTDATSGISISSISTSNWETTDGSAFDGFGATGGTFFPAAVMLNHWFQRRNGGTSAIYNAAQPQLMISGLHPGTLYTVRMTGSSTSAANTNPTTYTVAGATIATPIAINSHNNISDGATFNSVTPASDGTIKVYVNTLSTTDVADICGIQIVFTADTSSAGGSNQGLSYSNGLLSLGDSISGRGPHSFTSNRYQNLNGYYYSFGDTVNDPVNHPALRIYNTGDITMGTTMDSTVTTTFQNGLRYHAGSGILKLGGSDRYPTHNYPGNSIYINDDVANTVKSELHMSYFAGDSNTIDSNANFWLSFLVGEANTVGGPVGLDQSFVFGWGHSLPYGITYSTITGTSQKILKPACNVLNVSGFHNITADTAVSSLVGGSWNQFGGLWQMVAGNYLINRTPGGAAFGNGNVDFATLPYTGLRGMTAANLASYPLFQLGNSNSNTADIRSNALTVLFNGRTQINTTGNTVALSQTDVTPKAALDVVSTTTGVLLPRLTTTQRNAIVSGDLLNGLLLYNTDSSTFQYYNGNAWNSVGSGGAAGHWQYNSGIQYDSVNNIGIGTNSIPAGYRLAVKGSGLFTKVVVKNANDWADYVFNKDYALPTLPQVERYIAEHHHLRDIASEADVRANGIDLGDHAASLLKKVEELTLYLIDENKRLTEQCRQMDEQAARLEKQDQHIREQDAKLEAQQKEIDELRALILSKNK